MTFIEHFTQYQQNTHSSQVHTEHIFTKIDKILGHKTSLSKCLSSSLKIKIKLEIVTDRFLKKKKKQPNILKLSNTLLNNPWVNKKLKEKLGSILN